METYSKADLERIKWQEKVKKHISDADNDLFKYGAADYLQEQKMISYNVIIDQTTAEKVQQWFDADDSYKLGIVEVEQAYANYAYFLCKVDKEGSAYLNHYFLMFTTKENNIDKFPDVIKPYTGLVNIAVAIVQKQRDLGWQPKLDTTDIPKY